MNAGDHVVIQVTQMDPYNIAICFAPNLCPIPEGYDQMQFTNHVRLSDVLLICFLEVCINIFFFFCSKAKTKYFLLIQVNILIKNFIIFSKEIFGLEEVNSPQIMPSHPTGNPKEKRLSPDLPDLLDFQ